VATRQALTARTSLSGLVGLVIRVRAKEKMFRVGTSRRVAHMKNVQLARVAHIQPVRLTVDSAALTEAAIAVAVRTALPYPAPSNRISDTPRCERFLREHDVSNPKAPAPFGVRGGAARSRA
jgi:hypothetical protein